MNKNLPMQENTPIPSSPIQPQPNLAPKPTKSNQPLLIIIAIVAILSLLLSGYFLLQNNKLKQSISSQSQKTNENSVSPSTIPTANLPETSSTPDLTVNWKKYISYKYKYSLQYPDTIFKYTQGTVDNFWMATNQDILAEKNVNLSVGMVSGPSLDSLDKYINSNPLLINDATKKQISIDGILGYKISHLGMGGAEITYKTYVVESFVFKNGVIYSLSITSKSEDLINKYSSVFDQILSTFKLP